MDQDPEKPPVDDGKDDPTHDAAAAPMWAVYVSEAEKYDRSLVESWKSDMEGMLIFAGLFSASLTAFLIESYKTLVPDSGDSSAFILTQISLQLAASANGTAYHVPQPAPFTPPATSLICNVLWFISLGLSLTCALVATLLEQWARDFLHRADMRSAPVIRARVFSFLYYGLKRFQMHTVVEIIPLLLHASLLLFFIGLVAFLVPVNIAVTAVVAVILLTVITVYTLLTLLPLFHLDCPYRTPLSGGFWRLRQLFHSALHRWYGKSSKPPPESQDESIVESVFRKAMEHSDEQSTRDRNALSWTVKSLADDNELEPFIEALPDVIWAPHRRVEPDMWLGGPPPELERRYIYDDHMRCLMDHPHIGLLNRLQAFANGCSRGILSPEVRTRRQIALYKAVWALSCLSTPGSPGFRIQVWDLSAAPEARLYQHSANAMQRWANLRAAQILLAETSQLLTACKWTMTMKQSPDTTSVSETVLRLDSEYHILWFDARFKPFPKAIELSHIDAWIEELRVLPLDIYLNYLAHAVESESKPYRFDVTLSLITPKLEISPSNECIEIIERALETMIRNHSHLFETAEEVHWLDRMFARILSHFEPPDLARPEQVAGSQRSLPVCLPLAAVSYLNTRTSWEAVLFVVSSISPAGWKCVAGTVAPLAVDSPGFRPSWDHRLTALWRILSLRFPDQEHLALMEEMLHSVSQTDVPFITPSVIAMTKNFLLSVRHHPQLNTEIHVSSATRRLLLAKTVLALEQSESAEPNELDTFAKEWWDEAALQTVTEFIECCCSSSLPYKATETLNYLSRLYVQVVHPIAQLRFAEAVTKICQCALDSESHDTLVHDILHMQFFQRFDYNAFNPGPPEYIPGLPDWLMDSDARSTLKAALTIYLGKLSASVADPKVVERVRTLATQLDTPPSEKDQPLGDFDHLATETPGHSNTIEGSGEIGPAHRYDPTVE
ncbi:hypothetical protein DFH06DRAFT_1044759 [Mycena polygramma]|nr:hypothetical protein DFH06DRAFT_1044759 [Mycena polygramma]